MSPSMKICEGCDQKLYESVGGGWRAGGGAGGGICGVTAQELVKIAPQHGMTDWLLIRRMEQERPHYPLNMRAPDSVERWLAS